MTSSEMTSGAPDGRSWSDVEHYSFDKDGTLTDVHEYWACVIEARARAVNAHYRTLEVGVEPLMRVMGVDPATRRIVPPGPIGYGSREDVIEAVASFMDSEHGMAAEDIADTTATLFKQVDANTHSNLEDWVQLLPGTASALRRLKDRGAVLSIVTGDRTGLARESMRILGILDLFDVIIGGDEMTRQKPHPDGLLTACERVDIEPGKSAYVGDAPNDLRAAQAAQLRGVGVLSGLGEPETLEPLAEYVSIDVADFVEHLVATDRAGGTTQ